MAKIEFSGMEKYQKQILKFQKKLEDVLGQAIYAGASVVADEIKDGIMALPLLSGYGTKETPLSGGATKAQKEGLLDGFGIAPMQNSKGFVNVKLGFDGYMGIFGVMTLALCAALTLWLKKRGSVLFAEL